MKSMKFGQVQMDSACVSRMGGSQPNPSLLSPEGKTSTKQMKIFFFSFHLLHVILLHCLEVSLVITRQHPVLHWICESLRSWVLLERWRGQGCGW